MGKGAKKKIKKKGAKKSGETKNKAADAIAEISSTPSPADLAKGKGNTAFADKDYERAVECFTEAIALEPKNHVFLSNRSAAYLKMGAYNEAAADAQACIDMKPNWAKGYSRLASAHFFAVRLASRASRGRGTYLGGSRDARVRGCACGGCARGGGHHGHARVCARVACSTSTPRVSNS